MAISVKKVLNRFIKESPQNFRKFLINREIDFDTVEGAMFDYAETARATI